MSVTLDKLPVGKCARITSVDGGEISLRKHILDMGLTPGTEVTLVKTAPMGDPIELRVRGYELTLRKADAAKIGISDVGDPSEKPLLKQKEPSHIPHPGVGEEKRKRAAGGVIPEGAPLKFALAGNQNCGKTTLFNQLTGANQHVGNFPGVTVDRKDGAMRKHKEAVVTDLPGIYSLSPYTGEELVTREFLLKEKPDGIINILDATNIERNLYLTMQLVTLDIPMVLALNMMDEVRANGGTVDTVKLSELLGIPVVPISAAKGEGIADLTELACRTAATGRKPEVYDFCPPGPVHRCIHAVTHVVEDHAERARMSARWAAMNVIEGNSDIVARLALDENELELCEHSIVEMERETGLDRNAAIADMRYSFIESVCAETVKKPEESRERKRSRAIDNVLTHRIFALPIFVGIMLLVFYLTFEVIGAFLSDLLAMGINALAGVTDAALTAYGINPVVHSLVIDGLFGGVGNVVSFLPIIVVLFFFLSMLEDTGYMARVAFVMDKLLRRIGLSGKSVVPMLIGFGCTVPAVMAARTIENGRLKKVTALSVPFISCSAKIPVYMMALGVFSKGTRFRTVVLIYLLGILATVLSAFIMSRGVKRTGDFVLELPEYRIPTLKSVALHMKSRLGDFLTKAGTVLLLAGIVIWFLVSFDCRLNYIGSAAEKSILAYIGKALAPLLSPLGFGSWQAAVALMSGIIAKEMVVGTMNIVSGDPAALFSSAAAMSFAAFTLMYSPCVATLGAIAGELHSKRAAIRTLVIHIGVAWVTAFLIYRLALLAGL